jgi:acetoin utilization deacetylase AcuC-like enzyme
MNVYFSEKHHFHQPKAFFRRGRPAVNPETPERATALIDAAEKAGHKMIEVSGVRLDAVSAVHAADYLDFLQFGWDRWQEFADGSPEIVAQAHPGRHVSGHPSGILGQIGHYIGDLNCPMTRGTWQAAEASASVAIEAAESVLEGAPVAYAMCRPPGHHAFNDMASGFCFLNNVAIAAQHMRAKLGRVAILDIDIHHGNGTQNIFYDRDDVLFVSIHVNPTNYYPFYSGFAKERGRGVGLDYTLNVPYPIESKDASVLAALDLGLEAIRAYSPDALLVSLGFDAHEHDPHGNGQVSTQGFAEMAGRIARLERPTVLVQEGGYHSDHLGPTLAAFLQSFEHAL